jgi:hypothetical protein
MFSKGKKYLHVYLHILFYVGTNYFVKNNIFRGL